jgi:hypothetical protein
MARKKQQELIRGHVAHRRTEGDYMGVLLDAVTLEDWRDVVNNAKTAAKAGDPQARAWLAQYLMGRPEGKAPTPLNIVVQQLNGVDPLVDRLAEPLIDRAMFPSMHADDDLQARIRALVAAELADKVRVPEAIESRTVASFLGDRAGNTFPT